jgi:hypothetical protein
MREVVDNERGSSKHDQREREEEISDTGGERVSDIGGE